MKVCGLTRPEDVDAAVEAGADLVGFILVPWSPRAVDADTAAGARARAGRHRDRRRVRRRGRPGRRGAAHARARPRAIARLGAARGRRALRRARDQGLRLPHDGGVAGRRPCCSTARSAPSATDAELASTGPARAPGGRAARVLLAGALTPENVGTAVRAARPWAVDAGRGTERRPASRITTGCARSARPRGGSDMTLETPPVGTHRPDARGRFGALRRALRARDADGRRSTSSRPRTRRRSPIPAFQRRAATQLWRDYVGRPTPLYFAERLTRGRRRRADLPQARGPRPHRRAQDQQRARPGAARRAHGQAAHHRRDRRRPARRRDGDRLRALRPRVRRLHGRGGHAPPAPQRLPHEACSAPRSSR